MLVTLKFVFSQSSRVKSRGYIFRILQPTVVYSTIHHHLAPLFFVVFWPFVVFILYFFLPNFKGHLSSCILRREDSDEEASWSDETNQSSSVSSHPNRRPFNIGERDFIAYSFVITNLVFHLETIWTCVTL